MTGCVLWQGAVTGSGYGHLRINGTLVYAHRFAFFLKHGRWPEPNGLHSCDTPACVNADHIFEGTHADNMADMRRKGRDHSVTRTNAAKTHCKRGHSFDCGNTYRRKDGGRECRACWRLK